MELYNDLASNDDKKRISAAEQVVKKVVAARQSGTAEQGFDFEYALARLVKGLSSGRESARLGFSIALTEVLPRGNSSLK
jgi:DNA polymerase phi